MLRDLFSSRAVRYVSCSRCSKLQFQATPGMAAADQGCWKLQVCDIVRRPKVPNLGSQLNQILFQNRRVILKIKNKTLTYGHESWTLRMTDQRIDAFELWYWLKLFIPWTAKATNREVLNLIKLHH